MNIVDKLIERIIKTKNPTVVGLDPDLRQLPMCYKRPAKPSENAMAAVADVIYAFNRDIIDTVASLVPAVKPQVAFYEQYGSYGVAALEGTIAYARSKGLIVIEDAKRNDIGNTAQAYANGHLGGVETLDGTRVPAIDADFLTVTPFLGSESLRPFIHVCASHNKGIFVLVKTSNTSAGEIQDAITAAGMNVSQSIADYVAAQTRALIGKYGYSPIGAVVGATYPEEATILRERMPSSYFLVPGYGAQGADAQDVLPCFRPDGLGAVVNSSRGILYAHMSDAERSICTREEYLHSVRDAVIAMRKELYDALKDRHPHMVY